jgi:hypothetical protein
MSENVSLSTAFLAAQSLANGARVPEAAQIAGVCERTVYRWLANPKFRRQVARLQQAMARQTASRFAEGMTDAAGALRQLLQEPDPDIRLRAARALVELGSRLRDSVELESRRSSSSAGSASRPKHLPVSPSMRSMCDPAQSASQPRPRTAAIGRR